jgi:hypothetical protein
MTKLLSAHCNLKFLLRSFLFFLLIVSLFLWFFSFFTIAKSWCYRSLPETMPKQGFDRTKEAEGSFSRGTVGHAPITDKSDPIPRIRKFARIAWEFILASGFTYHFIAVHRRQCESSPTGRPIECTSMNIDNDNDEGDDALVRHRVLTASMRISVAAEKRK